MMFPTKAGTMHYLVQGRSGQVETRTAMRVHFWHWHVWDTLLILEEGNTPHPRFALCDILVWCQSLNGFHKSTAQCKKGAEKKRRRLAAEEARALNSRAFSAYGRPLKMVLYFKNLWVVISAADDEWQAVIQNQRRRGWFGGEYQGS